MATLTSAEIIRKRTINSPEIQEMVSNILKDIEEKISEVSSERSYLTFEMPKDIFIQGLAKKNSQRIVFYKVIQAIDAAGFDLTIYMKPKVVFHIAWITDMDETEAKKIDRFIAEHTKEVKEQKEAEQVKHTKKREKQNRFLSSDDSS